MYSPGRCGSTSLQLAIRRALRIPRLPYVPDVQHKYSKRIKAATEDVARSFVRQVQPHSALWVIVLLRNPFERSQSIFFQNLAQHMGASALPNEQQAALMMRSNHTYSRLAARFTELAPQLTKGVLETLPGVLGHPIEPLAFDVGVRHAWHVSRNVRLLVLRAEDSDMWARIISQRLGIRILMKDRHNQASRKWWAHLYERFRAQYVFSQKVVADALATEDMRFIYSGDERNSMARQALHLAPGV